MTDEIQLTPNQIYSTRPVIEIDGQRNEMIQSLFTGMDMSESDQGMSSLELSFENSATVGEHGNDFAFEYSDNDLLSLGKRISVLAGDANAPQELFTGRISAIEMIMSEDRQPGLIVLAEDSLQKARLTRHTKLHEGGTVSSIVEAIAGDLGIRCNISGLDQSVDPQMQLNQSDLAFIRKLVNRFDADLQIIDEELTISPRSDIRRNEISLEFGSQLKSVRILADLAHQVNRITCSGFDVRAGQDFQAESGSGADLGPGRGRPGSGFMEEHFSERTEHMSHVCAQNQAEADALVNASFSDRARRFVCAEGLALGNPNLRVGSHLTLNGLGPRFSNTYYVTATHHMYSGTSGYETGFNAQCAYLGE